MVSSAHVPLHDSSYSMRPSPPKFQYLRCLKTLEAKLSDLRQQEHPLCAHQVRFMRSQLLANVDSSKKVVFARKWNN